MKLSGKINMTDYHIFRSIFENEYRGLKGYSVENEHEDSLIGRYIGTDTKPRRFIVKPMHTVNQLGKFGGYYFVEK